jgi:hypothetical protein
VSQFDSQEIARATAEAALEALFTAPPVVEEVPPVSSVADTDQPNPSRRAFFRRVARR